MSILYLTIRLVHHIEAVLDRDGLVILGIRARRLYKVYKHMQMVSQAHNMLTYAPLARLPIRGL